ncbi:SDR family oxidoreductase [Actinomadura fibrosa]|uniref:SDR family oxidoreductase n=1 Tax=Actinomadura fibrosa TaxID=111802 RepID=A0ABW2XZ58_9ACTN|nr:SDR family NAD(P)-dependent oxidoreductase [Actinomadura fibrosa]
MGMLDGRRVLVVGASRGIGAAVAAACAEQGARVALAARSAEKLSVAAKECGEGAVTVACDVRDEGRCREAVATVVERLGGLDTLVYTVGMGLFKAVSEIDSDSWRAVFETNVFGAAHVTSAAVPHLEQAGGHAVYMGSESALYEPSPWRGIAAYIASKRALDSVVRSYRAEHPAVAFTNFCPGATITEFAADIPQEAMERYVPEWVDRGYLGSGLLESSDHARMVVSILGLPERVHVDRVEVRPR